MTTPNRFPHFHYMADGIPGPDIHLVSKHSRHTFIGTVASLFVHPIKAVVPVGTDASSMLDANLDVSLSEWNRNTISRDSSVLVCSVDQVQNVELLRTMVELSVRVEGLIATAQHIYSSAKSVVTGSLTLLDLLCDSL